MSDLVEVVIDKEILHGFKGRAVKEWPNEYAESCWGFIEGDAAFICALQDVDVDDADSESIYFDARERYGTQIEELTLLGSIHSHPGQDHSCQASDGDVESAQEEGEKLFGVVGIRKEGGRRFVCYEFFDGNGNALELRIAEREKGVRKDAKSRIGVGGHGDDDSDDSGVQHEKTN